MFWNNGTIWCAQNAVPSKKCRLFDPFRDSIDYYWVASGIWIAWIAWKAFLRFFAFQQISQREECVCVGRTSTRTSTRSRSPTVTWAQIPVRWFWLNGTYRKCKLFVLRPSNPYLVWMNIVPNIFQSEQTWKYIVKDTQHICIFAIPQNTQLDRITRR